MGAAGIFENSSVCYNAQSRNHEHIASPVWVPLASLICPLSAFALNLCFITRLSLVMKKSLGEGLSFYRMQNKFYSYTLKTES